MLTAFRESFGRWVAIAILSLIAITFIFWGIDFSVTGAAFAAKVNGENIPVLEYERELQNQQNQYAQLYRIELTDDLRRELRRNVLEQMVRTVALEQHVDDAGYWVSDQRLIDFIRSTEAFQAGGTFSNQVYVAMLSNQGLSPTGFEAMQRRQLALRDLQAGLAESTFLTPTEFRRFIELANQRREIAYALFAAEDFVDEIEVSEADIAAHYEANGARYMSQEAVDFEYIEIERATLADAVEVDEEELRAYFEERRDEFQTGEERRVRHILVEVGEDEEAARARAEEALARIESGDDFATVAAELSDDAGTANQGGDLGWIAPGMLAGAFEDALFAMEIGEVEGPVRSDFGFHVLRLEEVRAAESQSFEELSEELREEYRTELAESLFYDAANELADRAFDAYDELATVATEMELPLNTADDFPRSGDPQRFENSAAVVQAAFDPEVLGTGVNSDLVELSDDHVLVLRVVDHALPAPQPLEEVREQIESELTRERAEVRAAESKVQFEEAVAPGSETAENVAMYGGQWHEPAWIERDDPDVPTEILATAFNLEWPAEGATVRESVFLAAGDQAVLRLTGVQLGDPQSVPRELRDQQQRARANEAFAVELGAYVENIRADATVRIPEEILEPQTF